MTTRQQYDKVYRALRKYPAWLTCNTAHFYSTMYPIPEKIISKGIRSYINRGDYIRKNER